MRSSALILILLAAGVAQAGDVRVRPGQTLEGLVVPESHTDWSAHRVDADVFGWNKDFTEVGCIGLDHHRKPNSEITGESFLLVFKTDSVEPIHNVHSLYDTAAPNPEDPPPLMDVRDRMFGIDVVFQRMWPKRPKRKWYRGAMKVDMLWEKVPVGESRCEPSVGFMLSWRGERRFLPHQQLSDIRVSCEILRLTNNRTYWGRKDVAVVLPKFEFGSRPQNEQSFRYPVSARWDLARQLEIRVKSELPARQLTRARRALGQYGQVRLVGGAARRGVLTVKRDLETLALTLRRAIPGIERVEVTDEGDAPDIVLELGTGSKGSESVSSEELDLVDPFEGREDPRTRFPSSHSSLSKDRDSTYLGDFMPPQGRRKRR